MAYTPATRNWDRIQYEGLRRKVDPQFNELHDKLSEAYYTYKREGKNTSARVGKMNVQFNDSKTPEQNKELFDKLHGLIHHLQEKALYEQNEADGNVEPRLKERMEAVGEGDNKSRLQKAQEKINQLKAEGLEI